MSDLHQIFCACYLWPWLGPTFHLLKVTSQVAAPGAESALYDFLVVVIVVVINGSVSVPFCGTETLWITLLRRTPASSPSSECAGCHQQGHAGSKTLHQQNPPQFLTRGAG